MKQKLTIVLHALLIIAAYSSPLWLNWHFIALGVLLNYIQILVFKGCVLSHAQFEDKQKTFHEWYLSKIGVSVNRAYFNPFMKYVVPLIILTTALAIQ